MASTNGHPAYRVVIRLPAMARIEALRDRAIARRVGKSYTEDIEAVVRRLATDPVGWGELLDDSAADAVRRRGRSTFLIVGYSVAPKRRRVYLGRVRINPAGPLGG